MIKLLFLIHDLGGGGAEKALAGLVNHMDREKFDITVLSLFGGGVNEGALSSELRYRAVFPRSFPGNSRLMKLLSPRALHRLFIRERYDIEAAFLEGPCARIVSGCETPGTKLISWIHSTLEEGSFRASFRGTAEAIRAYRRFDKIVCVSEGVRAAFSALSGIRKSVAVLPNAVDAEQIRRLAREGVSGLAPPGQRRLIAVGKLTEGKGADRLLRVVKRLRAEGFSLHLYLLGEGPRRRALERYAAENGLASCVTFLGYQANPYKYMASCELLVCASRSEGLSTVVTEALILGIPVCAADVSGMRELLGERGEYGLITENNDEALYRGVRRLLEDPALLAHYRAAAAERGERLGMADAVREAEELLTDGWEDIGHCPGV